MSRIIPAATDIQAMRTSTEGKSVSRKPNSSSETRRNPSTTGPVICQTNEQSHHDLSTTVQKLRRGVGGREFRIVLNSRHAGTA
ncbi:hypothetical protein TNCV_3500361 [Trichonephila clavipes]|nr:hypothetical protein TNCV_3500361 [Trichonephila clavipes]